MSAPTRTLSLPQARPSAIDWQAGETALIVVDMQNGFLKPGGYFDQVGYDLAHAPGTIERVHRTVAAARAAFCAPSCGACRRRRAATGR